MISAKWYEGLEDLSDCHYIRREVFIKEQGVSESEEIDDTDKNAMHLVLYDNEEPAATARILLENNKFIIGRVAVLNKFRGKKYGDFIMRIAIRKAFESGATKQYVHAQTQAVGFYEKLGFKTYGKEYLDANIPHYNMIREGDICCSCCNNI